MNTLKLFVCENFAPEFEDAAAKEGFDDVAVIPFHCLCEKKDKKAETKILFQEHDRTGEEGIVYCSTYCDAIKCIPESSAIRISASVNCFNHFSGEGIISYIIQKGGYMISPGWLSHWREHIEGAGFDIDTARLFYHDFCSELVFFDTGRDTGSSRNLQELSEYLNMPYVVIPASLEEIQLTIKSAVYEWRLRNHSEALSKSISEVQSQCAEYAAILDLIGKISSYTNRRETINKIKEIFTVVLGAQQFKYWNSEYEKDSLPADIRELIDNREKLFAFLKEDNRFCIKIQHNNIIYGAIEAGDFLFPQYIEKYLNFALEIVQVSGLVMTNIQQFELLMKSENELRYSNFHDSLTNLFNRTYLNEYFAGRKNAGNLAIFMFDIDKLKFVNDNYGHQACDNLICSTADILKKCFRETDTAARIGGDEFIVILPDCDIEMAEMFKERIRDAIFVNNQNESLPYLHLSVSIGFAVSEDVQEPFEKLMHRADEIMYKNKRVNHILSQT